MSKSIYSLVLTDEVIREVDRRAYEMGTSRSGLINKILAEHLSVSTPEKRMTEIFNNVQKLMDSEELQMQTKTSDSIMLLRSILQYKYRPTMKYNIELYEDIEDFIGELKASFRTQSQGLLESITTFFIIWAELEDKYIAKYFPQGKIGYAIKEGRFTRRFIIPEADKNCTSETIGHAISGYLRMLDYILKIYFQNINDTERAVKEMEEKYIEYIKDNETVII